MIMAHWNPTPTPITQKHFFPSGLIESTLKNDSILTQNADFQNDKMTLKSLKVYLNVVTIVWN